ncbi:hypothetical protein [Streptomyces fuscichromogenes]|uniref:Uncharacterized protein n=1 Tax=Streptomyces fuscichromogenes TaxID=1324013 RepID=A0A917XQJ9_9ACTN|nr:hypothetical protein [Streptomyces fuscichromogenes]GGN46816.1 hypothetical protein GCM10011578_099980 [Streptomyces fuscichromogenes]
MPVVRAKFRCNTETLKKWGPQESQIARSYDFMAVYDPDLPEDQRYAKASPSGNLTIAVDNPAVTFEPGQSYYLDFTPVDEAGTV